MSAKAIIISTRQTSVAINVPQKMNQQPASQSLLRCVRIQDFEQKQ